MELHESEVDFYTEIVFLFGVMRGMFIKLKPYLTKDDLENLKKIDEWTEKNVYEK